MKKVFSILVASFLLIGATAPSVFAQNTPSGAPVIPIPSGDVRKGAPEAGTAPKIQIGKAETTQLKNGLKVIVVENNKLPQVSFRLFVDYDPILEKDASGYVGMMGELLSKGTTTRTKAKLDEEIDFIGARMFSSANGVSGSSLTKHVDKLLGLMTDVLYNPSFPQEELDKAKKQAASNLAANKESADAIAGNVASIIRYGKSHPYGEVMTEETLAKINLDQIKSHYKAYFKPNISYLVIVGDISAKDGFAKAEQFFGKWEKGDVPTHKYDVPKGPASTQVDFVHKSGAVQSVINITYPVEMAPGSPDAIPGRLMNTILGSYFNSRVNANLREDKAYTYGARTSLSSDKLIGNFNAFAKVRNEVTDSSIVEFLKELNRMRTEKVPAEELQLVKNVLTGNFSQSLERPGTIANFALNTARYNLPADYYETYLSRLQRVTADDVLAMAKKYVKPDQAHILVVGSKEDVADKLKVFAKDGKVHMYDTYGNPINDSDTAVPAGVTAETIIADYISAIGGEKNIAALQDVQMEMELVTPGPSFDMSIAQKGGKKVAVTMTMQGNVVSNRVYNGEKARESGMGGQRDLEGEELKDMQEQALFCKEATYTSSGYKLELKGVEPINGKKAYILAIERADGKKTTEYYDMASSLKVREVSSSTGADGQPATVTTDIGDYRAVNGVKFPYSITVSGVFPVPMKGTVTDLKVNAGVADSVFEIK